MKSITLLEWQLAVEKLAREGFPEMVAETLNTVAERAHVASIMKMKHEFVKLNRFSLSSMRFKAARPGPIGKMYARTGSVSPYLVKQDEGGQTDPRGGQDVAVPTLAARGGSVGNVIAPRFRLTNGKSRNSKFFLINLREGNVGLYYRKTRWTPGINRKVDFARNLVKVRTMHPGPVRIVGNHWHENAVKKYGTQAAMTAAFKRAMAALRT